MKPKSPTIKGRRKYWTLLSENLTTQAQQTELQPVVILALRQHTKLYGRFVVRQLGEQPIKRVKPAHTRLPSVGFRSWSRFLAVSLQVTWIINPAVCCYYFPPGLQLPPQPLRGLLPIFQFCCLVNKGTMGVNSLPKTVTRQLVANSILLVIFGVMRTCGIITAFYCLCSTFLQPVTWRSYRWCLQTIFYVCLFVCFFFIESVKQNKRIHRFDIFDEILLQAVFLHHVSIFLTQKLKSLWRFIVDRDFLVRPVVRHSLWPIWIPNLDDDLLENFYSIVSLICIAAAWATCVGSWAARSPVCPLILAYEIPRFFPFAKTVCVSVRKNSIDESKDKKWLLPR